MGIVVNRLDPSMVFEGVHAPDFSSSEWLSVDALPACDRKYFKIAGDQVVEMSAAEKATVDQAEDARILAMAWETLRSDRDARLGMCDWTVLEDTPKGAEAKQAWRVYRQALRDLPANTSDPRSPTWPTEPEV